eukprot:7109217-Pyramimonas_sp.AAC.1
MGWLNKALTVNSTVSVSTTHGVVGLNTDTCRPSILQSECPCRALESPVGAAPGLGAGVWVRAPPPLMASPNLSVDGMDGMEWMVWTVRGVGCACHGVGCI